MTTHAALGQRDRVSALTRKGSRHFHQHISYIDIAITRAIKGVYYAELAILSLCALSGGIFLGYLSSKTMSSARSQPARAAPLGAPRCGAPPARGLPGRATATARPSAPSARARPTRKPAVAREPSLCGRHRLPALARERVRRPYIPSSGGVLAPPSQGTCTLEGGCGHRGGRKTCAAAARRERACWG